MAPLTSKANGDYRNARSVRKHVGVRELKKKSKGSAASSTRQREGDNSPPISMQNEMRRRQQRLGGFPPKKPAFLRHFPASGELCSTNRSLANGFCYSLHCSAESLFVAASAVTLRGFAFVHRVMIARYT